MKHPHKEIDAIIRYARTKGWSVTTASGHAWGILKCPQNSVDCRCGHMLDVCLEYPEKPRQFCQTIKKEDQRLYL